MLLHGVVPLTEDPQPNRKETNDNEWGGKDGHKGQPTAKLGQSQVRNKEGRSLHWCVYKQKHQKKQFTLPSCH